MANETVNHTVYGTSEPIRLVDVYLSAPSVTLKDVISADLVPASALSSSAIASTANVSPSSRTDVSLTVPFNVTFVLHYSGSVSSITVLGFQLLW